MARRGSVRLDQKVRMSAFASTAPTDRNRMSQASRLVMRCSATSMLAVYVGWNLIHLYLLRIPSSLAVALAGIPCPTTGATRAIFALTDGDLIGSMHWNPFAIPICVLFAATACRLTVSWMADGKTSLSSRWLHGWLVLLAVAWVVQLSRFFAGSFQL